MDVAWMVTSVTLISDAAVLTSSAPLEFWEMLKRIYFSVLSKSIDTELNCLDNIVAVEEEVYVRYRDWIQSLTSELWAAEHVIAEVEKKRRQLRRVVEGIAVTSEGLLSSGFDYAAAVSIPIIREMTNGRQDPTRSQVLYDD